MITGIGGPDAYLESLQPINANYDTSAIDAKFKLLPPVPLPIPVEVRIKANDPWPCHYTIHVETTTKPRRYGATTWHGYGIGFAPGAIDVTLKDWNFFLHQPWTLDKLINIPNLKFWFRTNPELPGTLLCDVISGCVALGTFGGKVDPKEEEALNRTGGAIHWFVYSLNAVPLQLPLIQTPRIGGKSFPTLRS